MCSKTMVESEDKEIRLGIYGRGLEDEVIPPFWLGVIHRLSAIGEDRLPRTCTKGLAADMPQGLRGT